MRLLFDTSVMVAAIRSDRGASRYLLRAALERKNGLQVLISVPLLIEYEAVMRRPEHVQAAGISAEEVGLLLDAFAAVAEPVTLDFLWRPILQDSDDDMVLEAAVNGHADAIVTFNRRDFGPVPEQFGIKLLSPGEAVMKLEEQP